MKAAKLVENQKSLVVADMKHLEEAKTHCRFNKKEPVYKYYIPFRRPNQVALVKKAKNWNFPLFTEAKEMAKPILDYEPCFRYEDQHGENHVGSLLDCSNGFKQPEWKWHSINDLIDSNLSEVCLQNFSVLLSSFSDQKINLQFEFEKALLNRCSLRKKNERVYYAINTPSRISKQHILLIKELARSRGLPKFRVCLHQSDSETSHEMIMIHTRPHYTMPHCTKPLNDEANKTISYYAIDGKALIKLYNDKGNEVEQILISSLKDQHALSCRLNAGLYRSMQSISEYFIFLELSSGPFNDGDTKWMK